MRLAAELLVWELVCVGVWMASLSAFSAHDLVVAAACAVPCAAAATGARRAVGGAWRPPRELAGWLLALPAGIVIDAARILALPLRRRGGDLREVSLHAPGDDADAAGRRAFAVAVLSATPGTYVVATDAERGTALVHSVGAPSRLERRITG